MKSRCLQNRYTILLDLTVILPNPQFSNIFCQQKFVKWVGKLNQKCVKCPIKRDPCADAILSFIIFTIISVEKLEIEVCQMPNKQRSRCRCISETANWSQQQMCITKKKRPNTNTNQRGELQCKSISKIMKKSHQQLVTTPLSAACPGKRLNMGKYWEAVEKAAKHYKRLQ